MHIPSLTKKNHLLTGPILSPPTTATPASPTKPSDRTSNLRQFFLRMIVMLTCATMANGAWAHIKWFKPFDISKAPRPIGEVLTGTFLFFYLGSVAFVYFFFLADRYAYKKGVLVKFDESLRIFDGLSIYIMRVAAGIFFLALWAYGFFANQISFLTPELKTTWSWVLWLQLAIGLCAISRHTVPLLGAGIFVLYFTAMSQFGIYHMLDYILFLGIGYFFMATSVTSGGWKKSGFIAMYALTGISFLWVAVEKFAYPQWTYPMLAESPELLLGIPPAPYMILAGFVEFVVVFLMLGAASVVTRIIALALQSIIVLAILKFGMIDAVGHLMIIAILFVMIVRGPTEARNILVLREKSAKMEAYFMTGLYFLAFVTAFILYYGLHYLCYGN
jgi:hypothetical protein